MSKFIGRVLDLNSAAASINWCVDKSCSWLHGSTMVNWCVLYISCSWLHGSTMVNWCVLNISCSWLSAQMFNPTIFSLTPYLKLHSAAKKSICSLCVFNNKYFNANSTNERRYIPLSFCYYLLTYLHQTAAVYKHLKQFLALHSMLLTSDDSKIRICKHINFLHRGLLSSMNSLMTARGSKTMKSRTISRAFITVGMLSQFNMTSMV